MSKSYNNNILIIVLILLIVIKLLVNDQLKNDNIQISQNITNLDKKCEYINEISNKYIYYLKRYSIISGTGGIIDFKDNYYFTKIIIKSEIYKNNEITIIYSDSINRISAVFYKVDGSKDIFFIEPQGQTGEVKISSSKNFLLNELIVKSKNHIEIKNLKICGPLNNLSFSFISKFILIQIINFIIIFFCYLLFKNILNNAIGNKPLKISKYKVIALTGYITLFIILIKLNFTFVSSAGIILGLVLVPIFIRILDYDNKIFKILLAFICSAVIIISLSGVFSWLGSGVLFSIIFSNIIYEFNRRRK